MQSESTSSKRLLSNKVRYFVVMYVPVLIFCSLTFFGLFRRDYIDIVEEINDRQYKLIETLGRSLQNYLALIESDIRVISRLPGIIDLVSGVPLAEINNSGTLQNIITGRQIYDQFVLIDGEGGTFVQINLDGDNSEFFTGAQVPNRSQQSYFQETMELPLGAIYVSDIELNSIDGTISDPPLASLKITTPIFTNNNERWGMLVLNIDVSGFLNRIDAATANGPEAILELVEASAGIDQAEVWLLNQEGYWLAGPREEDKFGNVYPDRQNANLQLQRPEFWQAANETQIGSLNINGDLIAFIHICADLICLQSNSNVNLTSFPTESFNPKPYWIIASFIPEAHLSLVNVLLPEYERWYIIALSLLAIILPSTFIAWKLAETIVTLRNKEEELQQSMLVHEAFFERNPTVMFVKDLQGGYILANKSCREIDSLNSTAHETSNDAKQSIVFDAQDQQIMEYLQPMEFNNTWVRDSDVMHFSTLRFPMLDDKGRLIGIGGIATDITDQTQARKALRESETQFRSLLETAPVAVILANPAGKISLVNKRAEELFGYGRRELLSRSLHDLLPEINTESLSQLEVNDLDSKERQHTRSITAYDKFGNSNPVEVSLSATLTESGVAITCLVQDVSDRAQLEAQLRQSQKMEAIGKLTGGMAHDFNNLLGVIIGNLDLASRKIDADDPSYKRLETAKRAAERGAELTTRMLAVARRQPLQPKATDINSMIVELTEILPRTLGPDIEMGYDLTPDLPPVLVDHSGLENVLINLAINSRDAMPNGGKFYITTHEWQLSEDDSLTIQDDMKPGAYVHVAITDTGEGMSKDTLNRAFEPFFTTKERGKGTGLGLAMIYGFAKQSGGNVRMYSEPGVGTTIDLFLPIIKGVEIEDPDKELVAPLPVNVTADDVVLLVDDEYELLEVAASYLEEMGFSVLAATNGEQALRTLAKNPNISILLTDIVMPGGINGVDLANSVRAINPLIKVLYTSGFPEGVIVDKSGAKLDAPLIPKPYTRDGLFRAIGNLLHAA